jgi:TRAP transporter 4TM/12TM fusion protein
MAWYAIYIAMSSLAILFAINQVFKQQLFGYAPTDTAFLYWLLAMYLSACFLIYPFNSKAPLDRIPVYDMALFVVSIVVNAYFAVNAIKISLLGWSFVAPILPTAFSFVLWALVLEGLRRTSGNMISIICGVFSFYPLYASVMPGVLRGMTFDLAFTARSHAMSLNSILGTPLMTVGTLLVGFMIFGVVLNATGGGAFFHDISMAMLGHRRGGAAKVGVVGAALFGSLSGSAISNVVTIGTVVIPTMKKTGYESEYAGAIMACSSTGGTIMPPIMGAAAFIMASFMGISYADIIIAAAIPSILYYLGLFVQIDSHAAKLGLTGLDKKQLRSKWEVLKEGWPYVFVLIVLFYCLLVLRIESYAPFYASVVLLAISFFRKKDRMNFSKFIDVVASSGKTLIELVTILAGVGLIIGALSITGVALAFSRELVMLVGDNLLLMLLAGALTSFILGMGMTSTACYIFLAIVMAPALVTMGVPAIAAHFFVLYFGIISFITPPVAMAAFAAAKISGGDAIKTGVLAMQLGIVTYFVPFLFVYDTHLLAQGSFGGIVYSFLRVALAVFMIACALEGYLSFVNIALNLPTRLLMIVSAVLLALPGSIAMDIAGVALAIGIFGFLYFISKKKSALEGAA